MATEPLHAGDGSRPVPDPTTLTTALVDKAAAGLREIIEARLDGMDRAQNLLQAAQSRFPSDIDVKVEHLKAVQDEKFHSIEVQFAERDTRTEQTSRDSKVAVDAALQAAKEAVGKQQESSDRAIAKAEANTTKQIDQLVVLIQTTTKGLDDKIADLKDRLARGEGEGSGRGSAAAAHQAGSNFTAYLVFGIVGTLLSLIALAAALLRKPS